MIAEVCLRAVIDENPTICDSGQEETSSKSKSLLYGSFGSFIQKAGAADEAGAKEWVIRYLKLNI